MDKLSERFAKEDSKTSNQSLKLKSKLEFIEKFIADCNSLSPAQYIIESFFLKILGVKSGSKIPDKLKNNSILKSLKTFWKLYISIQAYTSISTETQKSEFINYCLQLMEGKFNIINKSEYFYLIKPKKMKLSGFFSIIVGENRETDFLKILVGRLNDNQRLDEWVNQEYCCSIELKKLDSFNCANLLDGDEMEFYKPVNICFIKGPEILKVSKNLCLPSINGCHNRGLSEQRFSNKTNKKIIKKLNMSLDKSINSANNKDILFAKNLKLKYNIPKVQYKNLKLANLTKILYFLIDSTKINYKDYKFTLSKVNSAKTKINECKNKTESKFKFHLVQINTNLNANTKYTLELEKATKAGGFIKYYEISTRVFKLADFQFLFDINFDLDKKEPKNNELFYLIKPYRQLLLYLEYLKEFDKLKCLFKDFSEFKSKNTSFLDKSVNIQSYIVLLISEELENIDEENNQRIYYCLCVLALVDTFPKKHENANSTNFGKFANIVKKYLSSCLPVINLCKNDEPAIYDLIIIGSAKMFVYAKMINIPNFNPFNEIDDIKILDLLFMAYLKILKENKLISHVYLKPIVECPMLSCQIKLDSFIVKSLEVFNNLKDKLEFIILQNQSKLPNQKKVQLIRNAYKNCELNYKELLNFLRFLKKKDVYKTKLICNKDILDFIKKHLPFDKKISLDKFKDIVKILKLVKAEKYLSGFDIKEFFKNQIEFHDFDKILKYLSVIKNKIPELFYIWKKRQLPKPLPKDWIFYFEKDIKLFELSIQESVSKFFLEQFSENDISDQSEYITKLKSIELQKSFKKTFRKKFMLRFKQEVSQNYKMIYNIVQCVSSIDAWIYFGELVNHILDCSNLKEILKHLEQNLIGFKEVLKSKDLYLKIIFVVVESMNCSSPFCKLLVNKISELKFDINFEMHKDICKMYMDYIENYKPNDQKMLLIIAISRVKYYLNEFSEFLISINEPGEMSSKRLNCMRILLNERKLLTFEVYLLKKIRLYQLKNSNEKIEHFLENSSRLSLNLEKLKEIEKFPNFHNIFGCFTQNYSQSRLKFELFPISKKIANSYKYKKLRTKILNLKLNINELDKDIKKLKNNHDGRFEFGNVFMNSVYLMHTQEDFCNNIYVKWYKQKQKLLIKNLGLCFVNLLKLFIENFPSGSLGYLHAGIGKKNLTVAILISYISLISVSYSGNKNQFSCQFFNPNGSLFKSIPIKSKKIYYLGAEIPKIQDYLLYIKENFETLKNKNPYMTGTGAYLCSENCENLYFIDDCGGANEIRECDFCKNKIGGTNHEIVKRDGHRGLTDIEAKNYLDSKCKYYKKSELRGFNKYSNHLPINLIRKLESRMTFSLLNFLTNSVFYFLHLTNLYSVKDLNEVYKIENSNEQNLKEEIEKILIDDYKQLENSLNEMDHEYLIIEFINKFKKLILKYKGSTSNKITRDTFEEKFEKIINMQSFTQQISNYKTYMGSIISTPPINLNEFPLDENLKFFDLIDFGLKPSWELMEKSLENILGKKRFTILNYYIDNFNKLENLKLLWPLLCFSRKMVLKFDNKYSRSEASKITINEILENAPELKDSFKKFSEAWRNLSFLLTSGCQNLEKFEITDSTPIGYFLIDNLRKSKGSALHTALRILIEDQNSVCKFFREFKKNEIEKKIFSEISEEDIFYISPQTLDSIIQSCSFNCLIYGRGSEIEYDYQDISTYLSQHFDKISGIKVKSLNCFNYLFETFNPSSYCLNSMINIRNNVNQVSLVQSDKEYIDNQINRIREEEKIDVSLVWKETYIYLGKLIAFYGKQKILSDELNKLIEDFETYHSTWNFGVSELFKNIDKSKIISTYEYIEMKMFDYAFNSIEPGFDKAIDDLYLTKINEFINRLKNVELIECINVVKRIIIRLLTSSPKKSTFILEYFMLEIYWSTELENKAEILSKLFPNELELKHSVELDKIFIKALEIRELKEEINNQE